MDFTLTGNGSKYRDWGVVCIIYPHTPLHPHGLYKSILIDTIDIVHNINRPEFLKMYFISIRSKPKTLVLQLQVQY